MTQMQIRIGVNALQALGRTVHDVACTLESLGIRGERRDPLGCPIALYMHAHGFLRAAVVANAVHLDVKDHDPETIIELPTPCNDLLYFFDEGKLPQLELEKEEVSDG